MLPSSTTCTCSRPAVEFYDCAVDPDQLHDLAGDPEYAETVAALRERLEGYLRETGDPRLADAPAQFDDYPYRAAYLQQHLEAQKKKGP